MEQKQTKQSKVEHNQPFEQPKSVKPKQIGQSVSNGVKIILYSGMILAIVIGLLWSFNRQTPTTNQDNANNYLPVVVNQQAAMTVEMVMEMVNDYCADGQIEGEGLCNSLRSKLDAAIESRDSGSLSCNQLVAFIKEVGAQKNKKMSSNVANHLIEAAGQACTDMSVTPTVEPTPIATGEPTATATPRWVVGTVVIYPTLPPIPTAEATPTFEPLDGNPIGGYIFSPARVVPNTEGDRFEFYDWVSDDEILVIRNGFSLEVIDVNTGESKQYRNEETLVHDLIWVSNRQATAYLTVERELNPPLVHLWIDNGERPLSPVYTSTRYTRIAQTPDGEGIIFYDAEKRFQQIGGTTIQLPTTITDYIPANSSIPWFTNAHSSSDKTKAVFFNEEWLMVVDFITGDVQTVVPKTIIENDMPDMYQNNNPDDFHIRAITWSPMGDKLVIKTGKLGGYIWNLFILNLSSETLEHIPNINSYTMGEAWAPDNEHLMILRKVNDIDGMTIGALYLVNTINKSMELVATLPNNAWVDDDSITWAPDGNHIVVGAVVSGTLNTYVVEVETE